MSEREEPLNRVYPHGRGYGHDYMRGGEVFGGYGYSARREYELTRGDLMSDQPPTDESEAERRRDVGPPN